jgi:hypothetical protein
MKQEILEEIAKDFYPLENQLMERIAFKRGYTECSEAMYSEEDLLSAFEAGMMFIGEDKGSFREWLENFKKK